MRLNNNFKVMKPGVEDGEALTHCFMEEEVRQAVASARGPKVPALMASISPSIYLVGTSSERT